jgi:simple sugar transport system ATP-binding protein
MAAGLGRIPEDRHGSVLADLSVEQNLVLEDVSRYRRGILLDRRKVREHAQALIERFSIKASPTDTVGSLSGGNIQKVLLARVLSRNPRAIVVAQPTRGLDVGAAEFVHRELLDRRAAGAAVLLVSEDLEELLALSDRLLVIYEGSIVGELAVHEATPERLGLLMAGQAA